MTKKVSTSEMTTIVAEGILLYARVCDDGTPGLGELSPTMIAWRAWCKDHREWAGLAIREQVALYEKVYNLSR